MYFDHVPASYCCLFFFYFFFIFLKYIKVQQNFRGLKRFKGFSCIPCWPAQYKNTNINELHNLSYINSFLLLLWICLLYTWTQTSCVFPSMYLGKFLYLKLTEYLEDFHPWLSVYSRPSLSSHTHTQRWSVCLLLLQGYMCVSAALVNLLEEQVFNRNQYMSTNTVDICVVLLSFSQYWDMSLLSNGQCFVEMGLIDVSPVSMVTGLCSALAVLPVGGLVSLVFRVSKVRIPRLLPEIVPRFLLTTQLNDRSAACIHSDYLYLLCMIYCAYMLQLFDLF